MRPRDVAPIDTPAAVLSLLGQACTSTSLFLVKFVERRRGLGTGSDAVDVLLLIFLTNSHLFPSRCRHDRGISLFYGPCCNYSALSVTYWPVARRVMVVRRESASSLSLVSSQTVRTHHMPYNLGPRHATYPPFAGSALFQVGHIILALNRTSLARELHQAASNQVNLLQRHERVSALTY